MNGNASAPISFGYDHPQRTCQLYNRTGATLKRGQIAMLDILGTQAETVSVSPSATEGTAAQHNTTPAATAGLQKFPLLVAMEDIADNAKGRFLIEGFGEVAIVDDDVGSADVNRGDALTVVNGVTYAQIQANGTRCVGVALEDGAADSAVVARTVDASSHLRWCYWVGGQVAINNNVDA